MNDTEPTAQPWERISSQGRLIYWRRKLGDGSFLAVSRKQPWESWRWVRRGPDWIRTSEGGGYRAHESGEAGTSAAAKRAADRAMGSTR